MMSNAHERTVERGNFRRNSFEKFGRYIVQSVVDDYFYSIDIDSIDWDSKIKNFIRIQGGSMIKSRPGLMYLNWVVATEFGFEPHVVRANTKVRKITKVKHTAMYLAATLFKYENADLQDFYNLRTHASIINAMKVAKNYMFTDKDYKLKIGILTDKLLGYDRTQNQRADTIGGGESFHQAAVEEGNSMPVHRDREVESSD